jgi:hypothetical protein
MKHFLKSSFCSKVDGFLEYGTLNSAVEAGLELSYLRF